MCKKTQNFQISSKFHRLNRRKAGIFSCMRSARVDGVLNQWFLRNRFWRRISATARSRRKFYFTFCHDSALQGAINWFQNAITAEPKWTDRTSRLQISFGKSIQEEGVGGFWSWKVSVSYLILIGTSPGFEIWKIKIFNFRVLERHFRVLERRFRVLEPKMRSRNVSYLKWIAS